MSPATNLWSARLRLFIGAAVRRGLAGCVAVCSVLLLTAAPSALADAPSHQFAFTFGDGNPTTATNVQDPYPISFDIQEPALRGFLAVDQSSGDVYVSDPVNHRVEKFNDRGEFLLMFGKDVNKAAVEDPHSTEVERDVCTKAEECQPGEEPANTSVFQHAFGTPESLAVDNSPGGEGDIYVSTSRNAQGASNISKFDSSGHYIESWGTGGVLARKEARFGGTAFTGEASLAVGSTGKLYIASVDQFDEFNQDGIELETANQQSGSSRILETQGATLAVDSAGNLYVTSGEGTGSGHGGGPVVELDPSLELLGQLSASEANTFDNWGFAVDPALGDLYQDVGIEIHHYDPGCEPSEDGCTPRDSFGAGHLFPGPGSSFTTVHTAVGVDGTSAAVYVANPETNDISVFASVTPGVGTEPATDFTETGATLSGEIDPETNGEDHGDVTSCRFEYGVKRSYGLGAVPCLAGEPGDETEVGTPTDPITSQTKVHADLTGLPHLSNLPPNSEFHFRLFAENINGVVGLGRDETFLTTRAPAVTGLSAGELTATSAHLKAQVEPRRPPDHLPLRIRHHHRLRPHRALSARR